MVSLMTFLIIFLYSAFLLFFLQTLFVSFSNYKVNQKWTTDPVLLLSPLKLIFLPPTSWNSRSGAWLNPFVLHHHQVGGVSS